MNKVQQYGMLWIALSVIFSGRTSGQCPHLANCDKCRDGVHCDLCLDPGIYGMRVNRTGCDDCFAVSGGICSMCFNLYHCEYCFSMYQGPVYPTTKAMCAACTTPDCAICASIHTNCDYCKTGFELNSSGQCVKESSAGCPHLVNCAKCSDGVHCDTCLDPMNYGPRVDRTGCDEESSGCPHLVNCAKCSDGVHCNECVKQGIYGLRVDRTGCDDCFAVSGGTCSTCTTLGRCQDCFSMYQGRVSPTTKAMCADCASHCMVCSERGAGKCDYRSCDVGYAVNNNQTCSSCTTPNCAMCTGDHTKCEYCNTGFELNSSGQCVQESSAQCPHLPNCYKCSDSVHCDECLNPGIYGLRVDRTGCDDCFEVSGGTCSTCTTLDRCDECFRIDQVRVSPTTKAMCA
jgi:hypothetical protein